ncbi:MAG: isopenicillin N synthase family dioxygenase [Ilumatobacter sp.]
MTDANAHDTPVPVIDIESALAGEPDARTLTASALDAAARDSGFFVITGHGVPDSTIEAVLAASRRFFALPVEEKNRFTTDRSYRGYQAMSATALAKTLGDESPPDLSESFNVGRYEETPDADGDPAVVAMCHENLWPDSPPELRAAFEDYFAALDALSADLLRLLAIATGDPADTYVSRNEFANSTMMLVNYYPAVDFTPPPGQLRRGAHSDYGTITLLYAESEPGLQIRHRGRWRDVPAVEGGFIVNIGDLLSAWVDGRWTSTVHRVLVPEGRADRDRISIPFFVHPDYFTEIPLGATDETVRAGEWIGEKSRSMMASDD